MNYERAGPGIPGDEPPPALPPRLARGQAPQVPPRRHLELERADWYWGNVSQERVSEELDSQPDGTFLVRDSLTVNGEYTLCVRKDGSSRLIRIYCRRGRFGFLQPCEYNSVVELISYYRQESLRGYNVHLDVRLERPLVELRQYGDEHTKSSLIEMLRNTHAEYDELVFELDELELRTSELAVTIISHKKAQEAYKKVHLMLREQVRIAQLIKAELHEKDQVIDNKHHLNSQVEQVQLIQEQVEYEIPMQIDALRTTERNLDAEHQLERQLFQRIHDLERELQRRGVTRNHLEQLLKGGDDGPAGADCTPLSEQVSRWLLEACNRPRAEALLQHRPVGTFLIRRSQDQSKGYVLSIHALEKVEHCPILNSNYGYGFSAPYAIHSSLKSLVDYYYSESELSDFNPALPERLMYPAL